VTPSATNPQAFDETDLVDRARSGDQQAFSTLVTQYERKIYRLALNITRNEEDAEDVLQEAFLKAYEHLDRFEGHSKFYTWLVRIAVN
jgi:RNA polymerase sigma-70 factor (ECF subfamily)